jgi:hypothetical protein
MSADESIEAPRDPAENRKIRENTEKSKPRPPFHKVNVDIGAAQEGSIGEKKPDVALDLVTGM